MTETKRSIRAESAINDHLSRFFDSDLLSQLSDTEAEILSDYFSNNQLKQLKNAKIEMIKGLVSRHVQTVERQRLTSIPEDELDSMLDYYKSISKEVEEVVCNKCKNTIAIEILHSDLQSDKYFHNPNLHWQGRFIIAIGNRLHGYRKRLDDVMGYRCGCFVSNPDYTEALEQYSKDLKEYEVDVKKAEKEGRSPVAEPVHPDAAGIPETVGCGNESTMSKPELEAIPDEHLDQSVVTQADMLKVKDHINKTEYKKPVKKVKSGYLLDDKFLLRKVQ